MKQLNRCCQCFSPQTCDCGAWGMLPNATTQLPTLNPIGELAKKETPLNYEVRRNYCRCHPETCACNSWAIFKGEEKHSTHRNLLVARELAAALNKPQPPEDLYARLASLSKSLEGSGRIDQMDHPDAYSTILTAMNFFQKFQD